MANTKPRNRRSLKIDGVFDIECYGWDKFKCGATVLANGDVEVHRSPESLVDAMLSKGGNWWGHNSGKYDSLLVLEVLRQRGIGQSISMSQSRVTRSMGGGLVLRDSYSLFPLGLERMAEIAGRIRPSLWFDCRCGEDCGGYCAIRKRMPLYMERRLEEYCVQDCEALLHGLFALQTFAADHDFDLCGTIGGSAWATVRRVLGLPDQDFSSSQWTSIRTAYFGGRCSVFRPIVHAGGTHWDMGSAYPAALAAAHLPVGEMTEHGNRAARKAMNDDRPGIYACTIFVPDMQFPPLATGFGSGIAFPVGSVSGTWTLPEIHSAIAAGCRLDSVQWGITWSGTENIFGDWVRRIYALRSSLSKSSAWGKWLRLFPNSGVGKMAERPDKRYLRMNPPLSDIVSCPMTRPCSVDHCSELCGAWEQVDKWGCMWSVPFFRASESSHVHWASYVTALSRISHRDALVSHGADAVYCDTDSLWTTSDKPVCPAGDGLGQWSIKSDEHVSGTFSEWEGPAPKSYAFTDGKTGERIVCSAGAFVNAAQWTKGDIIQDRGVMSILDAARVSDGLFKRAHRTWTVPKHGEWYGDRRLTSGGNTRAATMPELRIRLDERRAKDAERRQSGN